MVDSKENYKFNLGVEGLKVGERICISRAPLIPQPCNPLGWLASNFSLQCKPWITQEGLVVLRIKEMITN